MGDTVIVETPIDEVVSIVTQGPQGPSGAEAATLTTTGDLLYRAALANARLPIGSEGQVLKVASGIPAWGNESGSVTSVAGRTGDVTLAVADVANAVSDSDARLTDARTPSTHASTHATNGSDAIAPSDIGAQSVFTQTAIDNISNPSPYQILFARARTVRVFASDNYTVRLPDTGHIAGDIIDIFVDTLAALKTITIERGVGSTFWTTLVSITTQGQRQRFIAQGSGRGDWAQDKYFTTNGTLGAPATHTHPASDITSGTLTHERGGLEADVSAYNGLVKISGGATSAVTVTSAGEALLDDADAAAQRTTLGLGNSATLDTGTTAGTVAAGDHTHTQLHDRSHAITSTSDHTAGNHKVFYSNGSGQVVELALGDSGKVLQSNGASAAPTWETPSGGVSGVDSTTADVFSVSGSDLVADDGGTINSQNPSVQWDDVAGKLIYADPFIRSAGAIQIGRSGGNARGIDSVNIQPDRSADNQVASGDRSVCVGDNTRASNLGCVAIGNFALSTGSESIAIGASFSATFGTANASGTQSIAMGRDTLASGQASIALGINSDATQFQSFACCSGQATAINSFAAGAVNASLRDEFAARPFASVYWGGQTTDANATILNLGAAATNRFTIAANTALAVDVLLVARRSDVADKWLVARRFLGIRRDGSNNTSLIGAVQTLGTDQSDGSPTWTFTLTADDTNEALQLEVTGAASETVQWRATAFYRVV
jgi:hypothetical protein